MKTHSLTHEEVSQRAQEIWRARGCPEGCDTEIWFEAEEQLSKPVAADNAPSSPSGRGNGNSQSSHNVADPIPKHHAFENPLSVSPGENSAKADRQKKAARAPKVPAKIAPKAAPAESGKPLWDKPHSS